MAGCGFKQLLEELAIDSGADWAATQPNCAADERYQAVGSHDRAEELFREYCDEQRRLEQQLAVDRPCLWAQVQDEIHGELGKMLTLELKGSKLQQLPACIGQLGSLQTLILEGCKQLQQLPGSIGELSSLQTLDLQQCSQLRKLPDSVGQLSSLQELNLRGCAQLQQLNLRDCAKLLQLPACIGQLSSLQTLDLSWCSQLQQLPDSIGQLGSLQKLDLTSCSQLQRLPDSIGELSRLQKLDLWGCAQLQQLPDSIGQLSSLQALDLYGCDQLQQLPDSIGQLTSLQTLDLSLCAQLQQLPDSIGQLSSLETLSMSWCIQLQQLPDSIGQLSSLQALDLSWCSQLQQLPDSIGQLGSLHILNLQNCSQLQQLPASIGELSSLWELDLSWCSQLQQLPDAIGQLSSLATLNLTGCSQLQQLPDSIDQLSSLQTLNLKGCSQLQQLPDAIGQLGSLEVLVLWGCTQLQQLPASVHQLISMNALAVGCDIQPSQLPLQEPAVSIETAPQPPAPPNGRAGSGQQPNSRPGSTAGAGTGSGADVSGGQPCTLYVEWYVIEGKDVKLEGDLGWGSPGQVYRAKWLSTPVAAWRLPFKGRSPEGSTLAPEVQQEIELMMRLRHPHVLPLLGVCLNPPTLVTELCTDSLASVLERAREDAGTAGQLTWQRRVAMLLDAARGMENLHARQPPALHGDLDSSKLLMSEHWQVKVAGVGMGQLAEVHTESRLVGLASPARGFSRWLAPELLEENAVPTKASDAFAYGMVMWEMLTWQLPWHKFKDNQIRTCLMHGKRPKIPPPAELPGVGSGDWEGLPPYLALMQECWAQEAAQRPSFTAIAARLEALAGS